MNWPGDMPETVVVSFSGGKDSTAALLWVREHMPELPCYVVWADTGWEHPGLEAWNRAIMGQLGYKLTVVRSIYTFANLVKNRKWFPSASCRLCTARLKQEPIEKFIRSLPADSIIHVSGLRADESRIRAGRAPWGINYRLTNGRRTVYEFLPIHNWTAEQVRGYIRAHSLPLHPVYGHLSRLSCRLCIFQTRREIEAIEHYDPEAIEIIESLEEEIGRTMSPLQYPIRSLIRARQAQTKLELFPAGA